MSCAKVPRQCRLSFLLCVVMGVLRSGPAMTAASGPSRLTRWIPRGGEREMSDEMLDERERRNQSENRNLLSQVSTGNTGVDGWKKDDSFAAHEWTIDPLYPDLGPNEKDVAVQDWKTYAYSYLAGRSPLTIQLSTKMFVKRSKRNQQPDGVRDNRMRATATLGNQSFNAKRRFVSSWYRCPARTYTLPGLTTITKTNNPTEDSEETSDALVIEEAREMMKKHGITSSSQSGLSGMARALERQPKTDLKTLLEGRYEDHMLLRKDQMTSKENLEIEVMLPKPRWARAGSKKTPQPVVVFSFPLGAGQLEAGGDSEDEGSPVLVCRTRGLATFYPMGRKSLKKSTTSEELFRPPISIPLGMTTFHRKTASNLNDYNWSKGRKFFHFGRPVGVLTSQ